jgi:hypothetical protein
MKKIGLLLILCAAISAPAQQSTPTGDQSTPAGTLPTNLNLPVERTVVATNSDLYCAGFVSKNLLPNVNFVAGGLDTPNTTNYGDGEIVYLTGKGYELGKRYTIVRELRDPNRYETYPGQFALLKMMGQPYSELGIVRVVDTRHHTAIAKIEFSCSPILPGDLATPFVERANLAGPRSMRFDRFAPANGKASGRIVMARDFDTELGSGSKVYLNLGTNQGLKPGDYLRAVRSYEADLHDPVDSLSFKASTEDDSQAKPPSFEKGMFDGNKGPNIHVADLPRRAVGEIIVLSATPTTSTGMIVFATEDVHIGDVVELDPQ